MPHGKATMIQKTFQKPLMSVRLTTSITVRMYATGWRMIASRISAMSLIRA